MPDSPRNRLLLLLSIPLALLFACSPQQNTDENESNAGVSSGYSRINPPNPDDPLDAHIYRLENGLTVYLSENHEEPRFHAEIAVRAGSKHDPEDATGLAHYLEHLLFKGTQELGTMDYGAEAPYLERITELYEEHFQESDEERRRQIYAQINEVSQQAAAYAIPNEIDKIYNSMGASGLNAHTWHEETVYRVSLPSNRLRHWAALESHRFSDPVFRLFHTELEVVYEEKNRTLDNRSRISYYALADLLYPNHPYGQQPTIGLAEHLKNPSLAYIQEYFDTWYVPNNMAIMISGAIDTGETIALIAEHFGDWEAGPLPRTGPWPEEDIEEVPRATVHYPGEEEVQIAFRTVPNNHQDQDALSLLDMILDNRTAGLINLNLNQSQRVQRAGSSPEFHNDHGSQRLWGVPREGQSLEEVEGLLLEQLQLIRDGQFENWIIPAIVNDFKRMEKRSLESNRARTTTMRQAFLNDTDWDHHISRIGRMEGLDREDVIRVANRYFADDNYVAVYRRDGPADIPVVDKPLIEAVDIDPSRQSAFAASLLELPYEPVEPRFLEAGRDYEVIEYADGVPLYYAPNPLNDLFSFTITVDKGTDADARLALAASLLDKAGTAGHSTTQLQQEWYRLGSNVRISSGASSTSMSISGLDEQFAPSLALMLQLVSHPVSDAATLEELKSRILKSRQDRRQDPSAIHQALFLYNRHGEESPRLQGLDSEQIRAAELDELLPLIGDLLNYQHSLSYVGSMPLTQLTGILRNHHVVSTELREPPPYRFRRARQIEDNRILVLDRETAQAQVRIEYPDGEFNETLSVPASLYNSYFGLGMSSVVFQELREARALAYSASARYAQGSREGAENLVLGAIGSQNDKTVEATATFIGLFDDLPVSAERFAETRNSLINRYRTTTTGFRQIPATVRNWERLGLEADPRPTRFRQLQSSNMETLLDFHRQQVSGRPKLISIVGDLSRIDLDRLEAMGTITEVTVDDIFID